MVSLDDYITTNVDKLLLPQNILKFKHRIPIRGRIKNSSYVITGIPMIHNETNELVSIGE